MIKDKTRIVSLFLLPMLALYVVFQIYPFLLNIFYSLLNWNGITKTANFIGLNNYQELLFDGLFWNAVKNSFLYALAGTSFQVIVSFLLASFIEFNPFKWKAAIRIVFILPIVATSATIGIIMKSIFSYDGFINTLLLGIGIEKIPWLTDPQWAFIMILIISVWKETGTLFIYWMASFQLVSPAVIEAAKIDGANNATLLKSIILPIIKPVFMMISSITFLNSLKVFDIIQTLTAGGPYFSTDMISTFIYRTAFSSSFGSPRLSYASSAAVLCLLFIVVATSIFNILRKRRIQQ